LEAILQQFDDEKQKKVIQYASRTLNKHERNYSTTEKESLAIVWAIRIYKIYIFGRKFEMVTDYQA
jgi:hypothetical protein